VARDIFIGLNQCTYCRRPGVVFWDEDLLTCEEELCKSLAYAEIRRRSRDGRGPVPEKRLARAVLRGYDTLAHAIALDQAAELLGEEEAQRMREEEREQTAWLLAELGSLARRYPPPARRLDAVAHERLAA
jgi:selenocysteine lyase/cysteine desulfurase